jgi:hypothetical protein
MHVVQAWKSYRQIATQTAPPGQLLPMLFEGTLRFLERALQGFAHQDPGAANTANRVTVEERGRTRVTRLVDLERRNHSLLQEAQRAAQTQFKQSALATRRLRRLRASYAPADAAGWTSFS